MTTTVELKQMLENSRSGNFEDIKKGLQNFKKIANIPGRNQINFSLDKMNRKEKLNAEKSSLKFEGNKDHSFFGKRGKLRMKLIKKLEQKD